MIDTCISTVFAVPPTSPMPTPATVSQKAANATPTVALRALDTLWFQVTGTLCNLACTHCLVSSSPTNRTHEFLTFDTVCDFLEEGATLGVKESYFTGGEPFLHPQIEEMLETALEYGPATVLTNGLLLPQERCERLKGLSERSRYSLDLRVSLDGYSAKDNDAIRGPGTFDRVLAALVRLSEVGLNPVLTVSEVDDRVGSEAGRLKFLELLRGLGVTQPRLKVLPLFSIGSEVERGGSYAAWQHLSEEDLVAADFQTWDHLQCSSCRMVTDQGVWVCPILVNEPTARMGARLADTLNPAPLDHPACWTCHHYEVSCRT